MSVQLALFVPSLSGPREGVELVLGALPGVHGLCGVAMGPGPLAASGQLRLVTSS